MKRFLIIFLLTLSTANADVKYNPTQLDQFGKTGTCSGCDLSGASLYWYKNNADLSQAILSKSRLSGNFNKSSFSGAKMAYANLGSLKASVSNFSTAILSYTDLSGINASGSNFSSANLVSANLSYGSFTGADFTGANLAGANLSNADFVDAKISLQQLETTKSLCNTIMPDGARHSC